MLWGLGQINICCIREVSTFYLFNVEELIQLIEHEIVLDCSCMLSSFSILIDIAKLL